MLSSQLRIILFVLVVLYFSVILRLLKNNALSLKYTLIWLFAGVIMGLLVIFPNLLFIIVKLSGIQTPMYALIVIGMGFILAILMSITSIVSRQNRKIRILIQNNALLEKKIRELMDNHDVS